MQDTEFITLGESIAVISLFLLPIAFAQTFITFLVGRIRLLGWVMIVLVTYFFGAVSYIGFGYLAGRFGFDLSFGWMYLAVTLISTSLPWVVLPWRRFRRED